MTRRIVIAENDHGTRAGIGPVYSDDAADRLRAHAESRGWTSEAVIPLISKAEFAASQAEPPENTSAPQGFAAVWRLAVPERASFHAHVAGAGRPARSWSPGHLAGAAPSPCPAPSNSATPATYGTPAGWLSQRSRPGFSVTNGATATSTGPASGATTGGGCVSTWLSSGAGTWRAGARPVSSAMRTSCSFSATSQGEFRWCYRLRHGAQGSRGPSWRE